MTTPRRLAGWRPGRAARPARPRGEDGGYALVMVIGSLFVLTLLSLTALNAASSALPQSRRAQDTSAAMAAAQAGVSDLVTQVNLCRDYWVNPGICPPSGMAMPGTDGWTTVQAGTAAATGRYRVRYLVTPEPLPAGTVAAQDGVVRSETAPDGTTHRVATRVPPATEAEAATYRQLGLIRAEVTGESRGQRRVVTVDLRQPGFLRYIYYTDFESLDPQLLTRQYPDRQYDKYVRLYNGTYREFANVRLRGIGASPAQSCQRYWYGPGGSTTSTRTSPTETFEGQLSGAGGVSFPVTRWCDLLFTSTDVVNGPLHTNDTIFLQGDRSTEGGGPGTRFTDLTTNTSWADPDAKFYRGERSTDQPSGTQRPSFTAPVEMAWRSTETRSAAARGCLYTGATSVELLSTGRLKVYSPYSRGLPAECGGDAVRDGVVEVAGPKNGVVHVQHRDKDGFWATTGCPTLVLEKYPASDASGQDETQYDCREGDAFVRGQAGTPITVSAENDVVITDDIRYMPATDKMNVVGLVAEGNVEIYHPIDCKTTVGYPKVCPDVSEYWTSDSAPGTSGYRNVVEPDGQAAAYNLVVEAAIISMGHSFLLQNYDKGSELGTLTVRGGIYQRFRGPVGATLNTSPPDTTTRRGAPVGFRSKVYEHDRRMLSVPPPAFPAPTGAGWAVTHFAEQVAQ
jgi:hypothetical protein